MKIMGGLIIAIFFFYSCRSYQPLQVVPEVDLKSYSGRWYEIASFPTRFQRGCVCTVAEYTLEKDYVRVLNQCRDGSAEGKIRSVSGKAFPVAGSNNAKLRVQFFWPFRGDYWIIDLADDYSYAVVAHPNREYLWILHRQREMPEDLYEQIIKRTSEKGFDISALRKTVHDIQCNL